MTTRPPTTPSAPRPDAGGSRGRAREDAILAAAVELVGEVGYERMTVDAIAARAHASKATMYRRWPGKAELVADALRRHAQGEGPIDLPDTGSLRGDLLAAVAASARAVTGASGASLVGLVEGVRDDAVLREHVRGQVEGGSAEVGRTIGERAAARGELDPGADVAPVLHLAVAQLLLATLLRGRAPDDEQQQHLVDDVLLPLLHASGGPGAR